MAEQITNSPEASTAGDDRESRQQALEKLFGRIGEVSTLPDTAQRVMQVADDPQSAASDLLSVVEGDPALAVRILRRANSGFYSLRNPVADLKNAITLLGFREVRNLALTVYVSRLFSQTGSYGAYSREGLWVHVVAVATASRLISLNSKRAVPEEAYLAGLLHDIGLLLIDQHIHKRFRKVLDTLDESRSTCEVERSILAFDHTQLGEFVCRKWNFPEVVTAPIRYHHASDEYAGEFADAVDVVATANFLCSRRGVMSLGPSKLSTPVGSLARLGIDREQLATIWDDLEEALAQADAMAAV